MICRCFGQTFNPTAWAARTRATAELIAGVSDYDAYLSHIAATHPDTPVLTRDAFFRAQQSARFNGGGLRCC